MIRHSVFFWLDESLTAEQKNSFEEGLGSLAVIDVVTSARFGTAAATPERPVTHNHFDYALFLEFESVEDHNAYQIHPDHEIFVDAYKPWFREVRVFDTEF